MNSLRECSDLEEIQSSKMRDIVIVIVSTKKVCIPSITDRSQLLGQYPQTIKNM